MTSSTKSLGTFDLDTAPMRIGRVRLHVRDLASVAAFYQQALGLAVTGQDTDRVTLGTASDTFLELEHRPGLTPRDPRAAGLFHTAFLLPSRGDLGRWLAHARDSGITLQGAADHLVSEAVYLSDPEGNGIEVYADRPVADWPVSNGRIGMTNDPLDFDDVLAAGSGGNWDGAPDGTRVGHIHLQVGAIDAADAFWSGIVGFDIPCRFPSASFFGAGGYHHQLATNVWNSRGAGRRPDGMAGLEGFDLVVRDAKTGEEIAQRVRTAGIAATNAADGLMLSDPWGIHVTLRS